MPCREGASTRENARITAPVPRQFHLRDRARLAARGPAGAALAPRPAYCRPTADLLPTYSITRAMAAATAPMLRLLMAATQMRPESTP